MAINATSSGVKRELIPAGNYVARCYQMIEIGTVKTTFKGQDKYVPKVRIGWELPTELKVFKEENGEQPLVISKEFTAFLGETANLRKMVDSWRGKGLTEEEAKCFDLTKLVGAACMVNIIQEPKKSDPSVMVNSIASVTPLPKGLACPPAINKPIVLEYDNFNYELFESMPDFIKSVMKTSEEFQKLQNPAATHLPEHNEAGIELDPLPF